MFITQRRLRWGKTFVKISVFRCWVIVRYECLQMVISTLLVVFWYIFFRFWGGEAEVRAGVWMELWFFIFGLVWWVGQLLLIYLWDRKWRFRGLIYIFGRWSLGLILGFRIERFLRFLVFLQFQKVFIIFFVSDFLFRLCFSFGTQFLFVLCIRILVRF